MRTPIHALWGLGLCACAQPVASEEPALADTVVSAPGETGSGFGDASRAVDGVRGGGDETGSTNVFSLGYEAGADDHLVLSWGGRRITDGPGADVVVFENPFRIDHGPEHFMDPAIVEVSRDGDRWIAFPHDYVAEDETVYSALPEHWPGFAGVRPVRLHAEDNPVDPFDHDAAGGDPFDLSDLPTDDAEARAIARDGFTQLRITSAPARDNPDTGAPYVRSVSSNGPDIDGVVARHIVD